MVERAGTIRNFSLKAKHHLHTSGLYYKQFTIVNYDPNDIGQYCKTASTTLVVKASLN
jgi:hypothetical protein